MSYWPRRTTDLTGRKAALVACMACNHTWLPDDDEELFAAHSGVGQCPKCELHVVGSAYYEGRKCPGCGRWLEDDKAEFCRLRCRYIDEWARHLRRKLFNAEMPKPWRGYEIRR